MSGGKGIKGLIEKSLLLMGLGFSGKFCLLFLDNKE